MAPPDEGDLQAIPVDDPILGPSSAVVEPPVDPQLDVLPIGGLAWEDFERLLLDLGREELGLRSLSYFGRRGQAQMGLDVVGTNADGDAEGIQAKRYERFSVADFDAAVEKYAQSSLPFRLVGFVVGVSAKVDDRAVAERKIALNAAHHPLEIDIWDQSRISEMLRNKPQIVMKYFGPRAAERFCVPYVITPVEVAGPDALATADAVLRGPLAMADAGELLTSANNAAADDAPAALSLYREVQGRLVSSGFPGHAAEFDYTVAELGVRAGEDGAAIRLLMDGLWAAEGTSNTLRADRVVRALRELAGFPAIGPTGTQAPRTLALGAAFEIADFVTDDLHAPIPCRIDLPNAAIMVAEPVDRARTVLFAAECALGNDDPTWIKLHRNQIESAAAEVDGVQPDVALRLRLTVAEVTGDWADLIRKARTALGRDLKALTLARRARYDALRAAFADADDEWREAVADACLARSHADAADWLYSQRFIASRASGIFEDQWHPLAQALSDLPSGPRIVAVADDAREKSLAAIHYKEPRAAAINLRRYLLDAIRSASFPDEYEARRLLAEVYRDSGDLPLAARYAIHGGDYKAARTVAVAFGDEYHDVTGLFKGPLSWVVGSALEFATEQADLILDDDVDVVAELALDVIGDVTSGRRRDSPVLSPQMYLSAYGLLAALATRLSAAQSRTLLGMLADAVVVEKHHYRRTDDSHVEIAAGIARAQSGELKAAALQQLVGLYERGAHPFGDAARRTLEDNLDAVSARLQDMADHGHHEAGALLGYSDPVGVSAEAAHDAAHRLCQPTKNGPGQFGTGTGAINDSLLAAVLPADERVACIEMLLSNATSPWEGSHNRDSYLLAAANLADALDEGHRRKFFEAAMAFADCPPASEVDAFNSSMSNPLGAMRINARSDCRPAATYLAARLAQSTEEKRAVRDTAVRLIGAGTDDDYRVTRTLQLIQAETADSLGMLARGSWPLRCLAASIWARTPDIAGGFGEALSQDRDARVRRVLASELRGRSDERSAGIRETLTNDPRWSVRAALRGGAGGDGG